VAGGDGAAGLVLIRYGLCQPCTSGKFKLNSSCISCTSPCDSGTYESTACTPTTDRVCTTCPTGTFCAAGSSSALPCPAGTFCPNSSTSISCPAGTFCPSGSSFALSCSTPGEKYKCAP
jgi:hypothetical protein